MVIGGHEGSEIQQKYTVKLGRNGLKPIHTHSSIDIIVCYSIPFENNLGIKQKFTKYLK